MNDFPLTSKTILVTGSNGQLGMELQKVATAYTSCEFLFTTKNDLPIDEFEVVRQYFFDRQVDHCINCAAYTQVDKAESETEKAFLLNAQAVGNLARICRDHGTKFIHLSSDYVFDGTATTAYREDDRIAPVNIYGQSKLRGEELAFNINPSTTILRTSWVYSPFGNNFVKTMLRLMKERNVVNVVNDQYGCPTYAADLANVIMMMVVHPADVPGIYNYCNDGATSWYDFAVAIKNIIQSSCTIQPVSSDQYPVVAKRPKYSVLDTSKITNYLGITIPPWQESLQRCLNVLEV